MMSNQFLAFTLTLLGCLLVSLPQPAKAFTVNLLGVGDSYGEGDKKSSDNKRPIPHGRCDVFPVPNGNEIHEENIQEMNADEMSLDILRGTMPDAKIDAYLVRFGYLVPSAKELLSLEVRKEAIKAFQSFANLKPTGVLDLKTIKKMNTPRCGNADPVSNSKFANFDINGKWYKKTLTYRIFEYSKKISQSIVREYVAKAFKMWSDVSQLDFIEVSSGPSDLKIRFSPKIHGDGNPFDGAGGVLGHAFYPPNGKIHLDEAENWTVKTKVGTNLLSVMVHEIGHAIGLKHSNVKGTIMWPFYDGYDPNLKPQSDDIAGIQSLYGKKINQSFPCPFTFTATIKAGNRIYGFNDGTVYESVSGGRIVIGTSISSMFKPPITYVVDAAAYNEASGHTFIFSGQIVYRFTDYKLDPGFPKWLRFSIRAAVVVDGQLMAFSLNHIYYLDENTMKDFHYSDGDLSIQDKFPGLQNSGQAAVSYDDGYAYMLYRNTVVLLNMNTGEFTEKYC